MMFRVWETICPTTILSDLVSTSLLVVTEEPPSAVLMRCSAGVEAGTVMVVHSNAADPNAVRMHEVEDTAPISSHAQVLGVSQRMRVVAIPHITWKHLGEGARGRAPLTVIVALLAALLVVILAPAVSTTVAPAVAAAAGLGTWLLMRDRIPTTIGAMGNWPSGVNDVVGYALTCVGQDKAKLPVT